MNEHIKNQEQQVAVTPPPFRQSEEPVEQPQEPAASPTLAQRIAAMDIDEEKTRRLTLLTQGLTDTATATNCSTPWYRVSCTTRTCRTPMRQATCVAVTRKSRPSCILNPKTTRMKPKSHPSFPNTVAAASGTEFYSQ